MPTIKEFVSSASRGGSCYYWSEFSAIWIAYLEPKNTQGEVVDVPEIIELRFERLRQFAA